VRRTLCRDAASSPALTARRAGAGIGKSLAQKLAMQGLNVVLVALDVRRERSRARLACHLRCSASLSAVLHALRTPCRSRC
jgi:NAD(P)-dependent dehydrogenase (short-subunit alcohol dehydrogenase family)